MALIGDARNRAVALILIEMTCRAADRSIDALRRRGIGAAGGGLRQIRPLLLLEIFGECHHVFLRQRLGNWRHPRAVPHALVEIAQLQIGVAGMLAPDDGDVLLQRDAIFAMAGAADLSLLLD